MDLPDILKAALDEMLSPVSRADLESAAASLSRRYRAEILDGRLHVPDAKSARAYVATRLPATYGAVRASMEHLADLRADFAPKSQLDIGAGPGTAYFAARDCWPELEAAILLETSSAMRDIGQSLCSKTGGVQPTWIDADVSKPLSNLVPADLVTLAYVLNELNETARGLLVRQLWQLTADCLLIVEPGTPAGWQRLMAMRQLLLDEGAHLIAPCPHQQSCPVLAPDWCHFSQRVSRSKIHRDAKAASMSFEDEKYAYLAVSRRPVTVSYSRVLAVPQQGSGKAALKLCTPEGVVAQRLITKREGEIFRQARRVDWGDRLSEAP